MRLELSHLPLRLATGVFLVNSGLGKRSLEEDQEKQLHELVAAGVPLVGQVSPALFGRMLSAAQVALGGVLLAPFVPAGVAGAALGAFSGGLLWLYTKTPGLHEEGSLRPSPEGITVAKDVWMAGIAASLLIDDVEGRLGRRWRRLNGRVKRR